MYIRNLCSHSQWLWKIWNGFIISKTEVDHLYFCDYWSFFLIILSWMLIFYCIYSGIVLSFFGNVLPGKSRTQINWWWFLSQITLVAINAWCCIHRTKRSDYLCFKNKHTLISFISVKACPGFIWFWTELDRCSKIWKILKSKYGLSTADYIRSHESQKVAAHLYKIWYSFPQAVLEKKYTRMVW